MKTIKNYVENYLNTCHESLLDDDDIFLNPENDKKDIENWIKKNYSVHGNITISDDFVVSCTRNVTVKNKSITSLTNGLFSWGEVDGFFDCSECDNLISLEGAPKMVMGYFTCDNCDNLTSLEGAPKEVSNFYCRNCNKITSLKGAPEWVGGSFYCGGCPNLKITKSDSKKYNLKK